MRYHGLWYVEIVSAQVEKVAERQFTAAVETEWISISWAPQNRIVRGAIA